MLTFLKAAAGTWIAKVLLGLLVLSFAVWGITGASFNFASGSVAGVGSEKISTIDFQREYARQIQSFGQQIGRPITPAQARQFGLDQQVLAQMINQAALNDRTNVLGVGISKEQLGTYVQRNPVFLNADGAFDRNRLEQILISQGIGLNEFTEQQEKEAKRQQVIDGLVGAVPVPDVLMKAITDHTNESRTVSFVTIDQRDVSEILEPTDSALQEYFDTNKARYRAPEYRAITYLSLDISDFNNAAQISDAQAREFYDTRKQRFGTEEKRRIRRITFQSTSEAQAASQKLNSGLSFADLQKEMGLSDEDVTLGPIEQRNVLDKKLAEAAFQLELDKPSGVVDGDFGQLIVLVDQIEEAEIQSFEEVKAQIKDELASEENGREMLEKVDAIEDARAEGSTFPEIARKLNVKITTIDGISQTGERESDRTTVNTIPEQQTVLDQAFNSDVGLENDLIEIGRTGFIWYEVTDIREARDRTLDEMRSQAITDWKAAKLDEAVTEKAEAIAAKVNGTTDLKKVAEEEGLIVTTLEDVRRNRPATGLSSTAVEVAFQGAVNFTSSTSGIRDGEAVVLQVTAVDAGAARADDAIRSALSEMLQNDLLGIYINGVRDREGTWLNQDTYQFAVDFDRQSGHNNSPY